MELTEVIKKRRSIRAFKSEEIPKETILEILNLARYSPSAGNTQPWEFVLIKEKEQKEKLANASNQKFIANAPYIIVVCANFEKSSPYGKRGIELYSIQDTAIITTYILLLATERNLATCWIGAFNEQKVRGVINCPNNMKPVAMIPIGIANQEGKFTGRYELNEILYYERF